MVVYAIDNRGKIWAWGRNCYYNMGFTQEGYNEYIWKPTEVKPLNDLGFKAKKIKTGYYHTIILFEDENGKEMLYSVGTRERRYLGIAPSDWESSEKEQEKPFRELTKFTGSNILDFDVNHEASSVLI